MPLLVEVVCARRRRIPPPCIISSSCVGLAAAARVRQTRVAPPAGRAAGRARPAAASGRPPAAASALPSRRRRPARRCASAIEAPGHGQREQPDQHDRGDLGGEETASRPARAAAASRPPSRRRCAARPTARARRNCPAPPRCGAATRPAARLQAPALTMLSARLVDVEVVAGGEGASSCSIGPSSSGESPPRAVVDVDLEQVLAGVQQRGRQSDQRRHRAAQRIRRPPACRAPAPRR